MIKKLYKRDLDRMTKTLRWFFLIAIAASLVTKLIKLGDSIQVISIIGAVFAGITYSAVANVLINTFTNILTYFNLNFYKDESYLTHTLPVTKKQLILSKYLSAITVIICSFIVMLLSLFLVLYSKEFFMAIKLGLSMVVTGLNMSVGGFITIIATILLMQILMLTFMAFSAIVKGNSYNAKKGLKGVLWFIAYYMGAMLLTLIAAVIVFAISGNIAEIGASVMKASSFITLMITALVLDMAFAIYYAIFCYKLFKKGVNVD